MKKIIVLFLLLSGCSWFRPDPIIKTNTVEVKVPVIVKATPPDFLLMPQKYDLPQFQPPMTEGATSCLNPSDEEKMKRILLDLNDRVKAWEEWSK